MNSFQEYSQLAADPAASPSPTTRATVESSEEEEEVEQGGVSSESRSATSDQQQQKQFRTQSIRLEEELFEKVKDLAREQGVSVNTLAVKALRKMVEFDVAAEKLRLMSVSPKLLDKMLSYLSGGEVKDLAAWWARNQAPEFAYTLLSRSGSTLENTFLIFEALHRYGRRFEVDHQSNGSRHVFIVNHGMGPRWSLFYSEILDQTLKGLGKKEARDYRINYTDNQITLELI